MRRALRRAGFALTLAGTFGLVAPVFAQPVLFPEECKVQQAVFSGSEKPAAPVAATASKPAPPAELADSKGKADASHPETDRAMEIEVELALLADALTAPYSVAVHAAGETLEVSGFIPSEAVRQHVVEIACGTSSRDVVDGLRLHPQLRGATKAGAPEQMQSDAGAVLEKAFPECRRQLTVEAASDGKITVRGRVSSNETRLAISRCLREIRGCAAVANKVSVGSQEVEEKVTSTQAAAPPRQITLGPNVEPVASKSGPDLANGPAKKTSAPVTAPTSEKAVVSAVGASTSQQSTSAYQKAPEKIEESWKPDPNLLPAHPALPSKDNHPAPDAVVLANEPGTCPAKEVHPRPETVPLALAPLNEAGAGTNDHPKAIVATEEHADAEAKMEHADPAAVAEHADAAANAGKALDGVKRAIAPLQLQEVVATVCGSEARDLEVFSGSPRLLTVRMKVSSRSEGLRISQKIFELRELESYKVKLEIRIAR